MKTCSKCGETKDKSEYYFRRDKNIYRTWCKDCEKARVKKYSEKNKESVRLNKKRYYRENEEKFKAKARSRYIEKKEYILTQIKGYKEKNKERLQPTRTAASAKRRAKKLKATPSWSESDKIKLIYKKAKWLEKMTGVKYHVDHVVPLQSKLVCGLHVWHNLQLLEKSLNISKSNKIGA